MEDCVNPILATEEETAVENDEEDQEPAKKKVQLNVAKLGKLFFDMGSESSCPEKRRKVLYEAYKISQAAGSSSAKKRELVVDNERDILKKRKKAKKHRQFVR
jgi:hypothetical protein